MSDEQKKVKLAPKPELPLDFFILSEYVAIQKENDTLRERIDMVDALIEREQAENAELRFQLDKWQRFENSWREIATSMVTTEEWPVAAAMMAHLEEHGFRTASGVFMWFYRMHEELLQQMATQPDVDVDAFLEELDPDLFEEDILVDE